MKSGKSKPSVRKPVGAMRFLRLLAWTLMLFAGVWQVVFSEEPSQANPVYSVDIDSIINPGTLGVLENAIEIAERNNAAALIVRIDTPGGLLSSTRDMVNAISESKVPIITYVGPEGANAGSAGAFILLSAHVAVMNNGTNVGASSPVGGDGEDIKGTLGKKIMNDSRAFMRSIAESRGRNVKAAELFVSDAHSLTASEALKANVIDLMVDDYADVLAAIEGREILFHGESRILNIGKNEIQKISSRLIDILLVHIAHPQIAHLLLSLGILAIYIEIISPGLALPGLLGFIAVVLGMVGMQTLSANVGFLLLLICGIGLMGAELFISGFGVLGIGGAIAFVFGSLYLFDSPSTLRYQDGIFSVSIALSAAMLIATFLIAHGIFAGPKQYKLEGKTGEAMMNFDDEGYVLIENKRWFAETVEPLHHGDKVIVIKQGRKGPVQVKKTA